MMCQISLNIIAVVVTRNCPNITMVLVFPNACRLCSIGMITEIHLFAINRKLALSLCGWDFKSAGVPLMEFLKE